MPSQHALHVRADGREMTLCAKSASACDAWFEYLTSVASADPRELPGLIADDMGLAGPGMAQPGALVLQEGWVEVSAQDGRTWEKRWALLNPESRLLMLFTQPGKETGTERAAIDMLSGAVYALPPTPGAPRVADRPCFWVDVDGFSIYGPPKAGTGRDKDGALTPGAGPTAFIVSSDAERDAWMGALAAACDPSIAPRVTDAEREAAIADGADKPSETLLHMLKAAGMFNALGSALERKVELNAEEKTITVYANAKGGKEAAKLNLAAPDVRIEFGCDVAPNNAWSRLRLEITVAKDLGGSGGKPATQTHVFRPRNHFGFIAWANALAAL